MAELFLVCEGVPDSQDAAILKRMMGRFGLFVTVHAAGGDRGLRGVHAYLEATRAGSIGLTIEDRNYRPRAEALATWDSKKPRLVWSRREIENYLLHPRVLARAFGRIQDAADTSQWVRKLPRDEAVLFERLMAAARPMLDDHAARLLVFELNSATTRGNPADFRTTAPGPPPGARTAGRTDWLPALKREAARVRLACGQVRDLGSLDPASIEARYDELLEEVHRPAFLAEGHFLCDMGGHELLAAFASEVRRADAPELKWSKDLDAELVEALADVYEPGTLYEPDDFDQLRVRLTALQR